MFGQRFEWLKSIAPFLLLAENFNVHFMRYKYNLMDGIKSVDWSNIAGNEIGNKVSPEIDKWIKIQGENM